MKAEIILSIQSDNPNETHEIREFLESFCVILPKRIESIHNEIKKIKELLMTIKDDLADFATQVDDVTNAISANVTIVAQKIADLQTQIGTGSITAAEVAAALDPVKAHLQTVSENLAAVAANGSPDIPPVEPL